MSDPHESPTVASRGISIDNPGLESHAHFAEGQIYTPIGRRIQELIMKTDRYIVFLDEFGGVQWGHDPMPQIKEADYDSICNRIAELEVRSRFLRLDGGPAPEELVPQTKVPGGGASDNFLTHQHALFSARRLIAEGMARLLDSQSGSPEAANGILDTADKWVSQRSVECSRNWFLRPFGILGFLAFLTAIILLCSNTPWRESEIAAEPSQPPTTTQTTTPNPSPTPATPPLSPAPGSAPVTSAGRPLNGMLLVISTLLGGAGAFVSATLLNRKIPFDATAGEKLHHLEACMRFGIGLVGGFVIVLLIQGGLFLSLLKESGTGNLAACLVLGLLAGGSELFLPTLLTRFEESLDQKPPPIGQ